MDACATTKASGVLKVKTISKRVVASPQAAPFCVHEARSHSGTLTFHKRKWTQKERSTLEVR